MPLDPSIILGVKPPVIQGPNPLETLQAVAQIQGLREQTEARRLAGDAARQKAADDAAIRRVLTETGGDMEKALPQLRQIAPKAALEFETEIGKARKEKVEALKNDLELKTKRYDFGLKTAQLVDPTTGHGYDEVRPMLIGLSPELAPILPETFDPAGWDRFTKSALSAKENLDLKQSAVKLYTNGDPQGAAALSYASTRNQEEWDANTKGLLELGIPQPIIAQFGPTYSPENAARAKSLGIPVAKQEELAGQAATRAQTAAYQTATLAGSAATRTQTAVRDATAHADRLAALAVARERLQKTAGGRPVTSADARRVADVNDARNELSTLADTVSTTGATGVLAQAGAALPNWVTDVTGWGTDAKKKQAVIDRVKQVIGKTLEGGVLRKEDEIKYTKILPTISDPPAIVTSKLEGLDAMIAQKRQDHLDALSDAGYDTSRFAARPTRPPLSERAPGGAAAPPDLSGLTPGHGRTFNTGPYAGQTWTIGPDGQPKRVS